MPLPARSLRFLADHSARFRRYPARSLLAALAATAGCIALPGVAQAAGRSTPDATTLTSICTKVSPSSVSSIVGYTVPAGRQNVNTFVVDKSIGFSATATSCLFSVLPSAANFTPKMVILNYEVFTKSVTLTTLKTIAENEQKQIASEEKANNFKVTWSTYSGLGVTAIYYKWTASFHLPPGVPLPKGMSTSMAYEGIAALEGTKAYEAAVNNLTLAQSKLAGLVRLTMKL